MLFQMVIVLEAARALGTIDWLLIGVHVHVLIQIKLTEKILGAHRTFSMILNMIVVLALPFKFSITNWTYFDFSVVYCFRPATFLG